MTDRQLEYWAGGTIMVLCLLIGAPVLLSQLTGDGLIAGPVGFWWACYLGYLAGLASLFWFMESSRVASRVALTVQAGSGAGAVLLAPELGWTPILLVFTTAVAAHVVSSSATMALLVANTGVVGVGAYLADAATTEVAFSAGIYAALQACTVWAVRLELRETEARRQLSVANTELRAATAQLAESSRTSERLRIARDLHDAVGHQLTALSLELEVAAHWSEAPASEHVERARRLSKDLLTDVRHAVGELRTRSPRLREALHEMVTDLPRPRVHLIVDDSLELSEEHVSALIRCAQEAVTNTIRHSEAENLWITVAAGETGDIALTATDDGHGTPLLRLGNGLTGLRERVEQLGGAVSIDSRPGFRISAEVPAP